MGAGGVPADARGRALRPAGDAGRRLGPPHRCCAARPAGHGGRAARDADAARGPS
jgi:hypothetical protein